ncbi:MAG: hypothetical protein N2321_01165 [Melioribacteraceae bacterium]|nr:hypothetical protein [Melioribacteraceae bacterium]
MDKPKSVITYQKKFTNNKWKVFSSVQKLYENIFVIPAIAEYDNLKKLFTSILGNNQKYFDSTLFVIVINNLKSTDELVKEENQKTISYFNSIINKTSIDDLSEKIISSNINIGLIDASSENLEMPENDGGVGFARKIGMDLALNYFDYSSSKKKMIYCLDSDCLVSNNYLETLIEEVNQKNIYAGYVEYEHQLPEDDEEKKAIILYEIFLRYYVLGLKYATSPFAFDTIGSTMFCDYEHYIKIGGMNKKKAAEDFYFLEKLAKIIQIEKINKTKIFPSSRKSWRVPFGTGQRVNRYFQKTHNENLVYNPLSFEILKKWNELFFNNEILSADDYLFHAEKIDIHLKKFLIEQYFESAWNKILNETNKKEQIQKQKKFWFDGFRTLKLIHYLRDLFYPMIEYEEAINYLFEKMEIQFQNKYEKVNWMHSYLYLQKLREINF